MQIHILSLFPESVRAYLDSSIMKKAQEKGLFQYSLHNLTDWTVKNTRRVDDRPYGGLPGTLLMVEPLAKALRYLETKYGKMRIVYLSPRGVIHTQESAIRYAESGENYCIICGHYEGIDERIFSLFPIEEISLGNYVLTSGEIASLVWIDSVVRLLPGVLNKESLEEESFSAGLGGSIEYPQYTRPEVFENLRVPKELISGNKQLIEQWKKHHVRKCNYNLDEF